MASSPPSPSRSNNELSLQQSDVESQLSSLIDDLLQRMQAAAEDMLKMTNEIGKHSSAVTDGLVNCKGVALERKTNLEEERVCSESCICYSEYAEQLAGFVNAPRLSTRRRKFKVKLHNAVLYFYLNRHTSM